MDPHHTKDAYEGVQGSQVKAKEAMQGLEDYASTEEDARSKLEAHGKLVAEEAMGIKRNASPAKNGAFKGQEALHLPAGPITRGRAKMFKLALSVLVSTLVANGVKTSMESMEGLGLTSMVKIIEDPSP